MALGGLVGLVGDDLALSGLVSGSALCDLVLRDLVSRSVGHDLVVSGLNNGLRVLSEIVRNGLARGASGRVSAASNARSQQQTGLAARVPVPNGREKLRRHFDAETAA
eukprot:4750907-Pyramimonas_sp.AAC.1